MRYERTPEVLRVIGAWNAVIPCTHLTSENADAVIAREGAFFRSVARRQTNSGETQSLEWKVYDYDLPPDLRSRLAAAGFEPDEPETLMVFDWDTELGGGDRAPDVEIRRVGDAAGLADAMEAARIAFGRDAAWQAAREEQYASWLGDPAMSLYVAYAGDRPIASGRAEFPKGRSFAGLWGAGTVPEYRGRGVYRALVSVRAEEARRRGYRYLRVDARETSRPILERLGFMPLARIVEWKLRL